MGPGCRRRAGRRGRGRRAAARAATGTCRRRRPVRRTACTRTPASASQPSTHGLASSRRRPAASASRWASRRTAASSGRRTAAALEPRAPVHPDGPAAADEDVGGARVAQQLVEGTGSGELLPEHPQRGEHVEVRRHPAGLGADGGRDGRRRGWAARGGEPGAHPVDEDRVDRRPLRRGAGDPVMLGRRRPRHDARPAAAVRSASSTDVAAVASGPRARPGALPRFERAREPPFRTHRRDQRQPRAP